MMFHVKHCIRVFFVIVHRQALLEMKMTCDKDIS